MRLDSAAVDARPVPPATWVALGALVLLLGALALFLMGCDRVVGLTRLPPCPPGEIVVGDMCVGRHPNHYVCACDCIGFGIGARIAVNNAGQSINVRQTPGGTPVGTAPNAAQGVIVAGPVQADLAGVSETWWQVDFDNTTIDGWVVQRFLTVVTGVSVLAKEIDVCVTPVLNENLDGGHKPTVPELNNDCSTERVLPQLAAITGQQLPPQTQCACNVNSDPLPWVAECDAPCSDPSGVCAIAGADPETPTPDPLPAVVFATASVCEVTGQAEIHIPGEGVKFTPAQGFVQIHGRPCLPGQTCQVGISYQLTMDPISFPVRFHKDPKFIELGLSGASEPGVLTLAPGLFGLHMGQVATGATLNSIRGRRDGLISHLLNRNVVMVARNAAPLEVAVDWAGKHCLINGNIAQTSGSVEDDDGATQPIKVLMTLGGQTNTLSRILNQPPRANAGADQTVECTSPQGAAVTLNASLTTDPDNNIAFFAWRHDSDSGPHVADPSFTPILPPIQQALGEKTYHLRVVDRRFAADSTSVKVRVVDTTPPHTIDCHAPAVIPKQDTPITFAATAEDTCGASGVVVESFECFKVTPEGRIKDNPSCKGSIAGSTLTIGNSAGADLIRWRIRAADGSANAALKTCEVSVSP